VQIYTLPYDGCDMNEVIVVYVVQTNPFDGRVTREDRSICQQRLFLIICIRTSRIRYHTLVICLN
jgi:hypothetical protein